MEDAMPEALKNLVAQQKSEDRARFRDVDR